MPLLARPGPVVADRMPASGRAPSDRLTASSSPALASPRPRRMPHHFRCRPTTTVRAGADPNSPAPAPGGSGGPGDESGWGGAGGGKGGGGDIGGGDADADDSPPRLAPRRLLPILAALAAGTAGGAATVAALSSSSTPTRDPATGGALPHPRDLPTRVAGLSGEVSALRRLMADAYASLHALDQRVGGLEPEGASSPSSTGGARGSGGFLSHPAVRAGTRAAAAAARFPALADLRRRAGGAGRSRLKGGGGASLPSGVDVEGEVGCTAVVMSEGGGRRRPGGGGGGAPSTANLAAPAASATACTALVAALDTGTAAGPGPAVGGVPLPSGPGTATLALHGPARGGRDAWLALVDVSAASGAGAGALPWSPLSPTTGGGGGGALLTKASYSWGLTRRGRVTLTPVGGAGADAAPPLHPPAGTGLTAAARRGCAAHRLCSAGGGGEPAAPSISARYRWRDAGLSVARFGGGAALAQVDGTPADGVSVGVVAVQTGGGVLFPRRRPPPAAAAPATPPAPDPTSSSDWSDASSAGDGVGGGWWGGGGGREGAPHHHHHHHAHHPRTCLAAMGVLDLPPGGSDGGVALLSGWVSAELASEPAPSSLSPPHPAPSARAWGATLASPPGGPGVGWTLTLSGGSRRADPLVGEAGLTVPLGGDGAGTLFPGVVLCRAGGRVAGMVGCRSSWGF